MEKPWNNRMHDFFDRAIAVHGLQFDPEVATANRATLGGMLGNNSAGARSIVYGTERFLGRSARHRRRPHTRRVSSGPDPYTCLAPP